MPVYWATGFPNNLTRQMASHILDNPIWQSLSTSHSKFAVGNGQVKRYPQAIGPFISVASPDASAEPEMAAIVATDEFAYFVGVAPLLSSRWRMEEQAPVVQMIYSSGIEAAESDVQISVLSEPDVLAMLALTSLVYPEYFRSRTPELGTYLGIYQNGRLAAMAGERMYLTGYREISAVCTHPDFLGRGHASLLVKQLVNDTLNRDEIPFLHVSSKNVRAKSLYERLGFVTRCLIPLWRIQRQQ